MSIDFGTTPTTKAPTSGGPYVWVGDEWVAVMTDTGDGVPESLDLDSDNLTAERISDVDTMRTIVLTVGGKQLLARVRTDFDKLKFNPAQKRDPDGKWTDGGYVKKPSAPKSDDELLKTKPWVKGDRGIGAPGEIYTDEAELNAFRLLENYGQVEPGITSELSGAASKFGGRMEGLQYRLKGQESLARKIEQKSASKGLTMQQYTAKIGDALRYTMVVPSGRYGDGAQAAIDDFRKRGYEVEVENTWKPGAPYKGINTNMKKDGVIFEVQFHTPESLDLKMAAHGLYELARDTTKSPEERAAATKQMIDNATALPDPPGAADVK